MLDHAKELGILKSVSDEGEFWEKRNIEALSREVGSWNEMIAGLAGELKKSWATRCCLPSRSTRLSSI